MLTVMIIGSSRGVSFLDSYKSYPAPLQTIQGNESALDWNLDALRETEVDNFVYVGGYHLEKVVQQYPNFRYVYHSKWSQEGTIKALLCGAQYLENDVLILDDQTIFNHRAISELLNSQADIVLGVVASGENGLAADGVGDLSCSASAKDKLVRFTGLIKCTANGARFLLQQANKIASENCCSTVADLAVQLYSFPEMVDSVDLSGKCSFLDRPSALSQFVFGTKAQTLERLQSVLKAATILDQVRFSVVEWQGNPDAILKKITRHLGAEQLVVRSSALSEDAWLTSNAGRFRSILNVNGRFVEEISSAIEGVIESYRQSGEACDDNQVFVQQHVDSVEMSGAMFTRDLETHAPYYVINYHLSNKTDSVTGGNEAEIKTVIVCKDASSALLGDKFRALIEMAREVEFLMGCDCLDIEFAFNTKGQLFLLQVRPIATPKHELIPNDEDFAQELNEAKGFVQQIFQPCPYLFGDAVVLSNMSDWNPAELIGVYPRPLALSIFKYLITDSVWGQARTAANYRDTYPSSLLVTVAGQPYINVRASFNSFIPSGIKDNLAEKCVNGYLDYLSKNHQLHDKVEFEVAVTCMTFDFDLHAARLRQLGLSPEEVEELRVELLSLTDDLILQRRVSFAKQIESLGILEQKRERLLSFDDNNKTNLPNKVLHLLDDCKRYGTLPFSILARNGFIALSMLRSIFYRGVITRDEYEQCQQIPTVATEVSAAMMGVLSGNLSVEAFLLQYGHLRPGTYDILSPNYRQAPHIYLARDSGKMRNRKEPASDTAAIAIFNKHAGEIGDLLRENGFSSTPEQLRDFILNSIKGREFAKFEYTKNINLALELISQLCKMWGMCDDDISYLSIHDIVGWATTNQHCAMDNKLRRQSMFEKKRYALNCSVKLPGIICSPVDLECFEVAECKPNFITTKTVSAEVVALDEHVNAPPHLQGKIVAIKNADPGFDWIFVHGVAGLVTQYGGAASHMAIRAAEFSLPAAIGCGEALFKRATQATMITLDCVGQQIKVIY